jgi:hypothetical protein
VASYYVYSGAGGAGTGADWANAFTTLDGAFSGKAAGDIFYVAHDHAQTQASALTLTSPGTDASPCFIYCVNRAGSVPPVSADLRATATVTTTGANILAFGTQTAYYYGIIFSSGSGATNTALNQNAGRRVRFDACSLRAPGTTSSTAKINFGSTTGSCELVNTTLHFGAAADGVGINTPLIWRNTASALGGTTLTTGLFATGDAQIFLEGVDLSGLGAGASINRALSSRIRSMTLKHCKIGAGAVADQPSTASVLPYGSVNLIRCDSGDTNYRTERHCYMGSLTTETTIVRTGGASDGTTPISWKVVTTANSERIYPFEAFPISIWNETTGSAVTVTVECRGASVPNLDEMWMDCEYLGTSGFPQGNFSTTGHADLLATGTANTSSSESWGGSTSSFKLVATITPQEKGPITVYVKIAKVSSTFYIDPKITLS